MIYSDPHDFTLINVKRLGKAENLSYFTESTVDSSFNLELVVLKSLAGHMYYLNQTNER